MSRFQLSEGSTQKDIGRTVVKAAADAFQARQNNDGQGLTAEDIDRLQKEYSAQFSQLFSGQNVRVVFDEKDLGHVIIPFLDPKAGDGGYGDSPFNLDDILEECLGNVVFAGCGL